MKKLHNSNHYHLYLWNWGAFLLAPFWSLFYRICWGMLTWTPWLMITIIIGLIKMPIFGIKGKIIAVNMAAYFLPLVTIAYIIISFLIGINGNMYAIGKLNSNKDLVTFNKTQHYWLALGIFLGPIIFIATITISERLIEWAYYAANII
jgi:hypothetical protein